MADDIKVKMSEFAQATQVNNADDIIILQNGENKKVKSPVLESKIINRTVEELSKDGGVSLNLVNLKGVVATYANLPTTNLQINDAYQVEADGLVYVYTESGFQAEGEGFKIQPDVNGVVEQGNTNAVSGGEVYEKFGYVNETLKLDVEPITVRRGIAATIPSTYTAIGNAVMKFTEVRVGQNINISRDVIEGNRFRIVKCVNRLPEEGDIVVDIFNDSTNTTMNYNYTSDFNGYVGVLLVTHSGYDPLLNYDISFGRYMDSEDLKTDGIVELNNKKYINGDTIYKYLLDNEKYFYQVYFSKNAMSAEGMLIGNNGGLLLFKANKNDLININRDSVIGNRFTIYTFNQESKPTIGDVGTVIFRDDTNTILNKDISVNIDCWVGVLLANSSGYVEDDKYYITAYRKSNYNDFLYKNNKLYKNVTIKLDRGSLSNQGKISAYNWQKTWKDSEFYKNGRTTKFVNIDARLQDYFNVDLSNLSGYELKVYQFDELYNILRVSIVTNSKIELYNTCRYIKFSLKKVDSSDIDLLPIINISALIENDIYTYNTSDYDFTTVSLINVQTNVGRDYMEEVTVLPNYQIETQEYYSHCILRTPLNYNPKGNPTRVIMFAHSSDAADITDFNTNYMPYVKYLVDEGYMVIDVFAWTNKEPNGIQYSGTPTNISCVNSMWNFISSNYNVKRDGVFVFGKSRGGFQVFQAEYCFNFPVLAVAGLAPAIYPFKNNYGYTTLDIDTAMLDFNITEDTTPISKEGGNNYRLESREWFKSNYNNFIGYMPMFMGAINITPEIAIPNTLDFNSLNFNAISRVPTKVWVSPDDPIGVPELLCRKRAVESTNGVFEMRFMQVGNPDPHHTVDYAGPFVEEIKTSLNVTHTNVPVAWVEMLQFFKRYEI